MNPTTIQMQNGRLVKFVLNFSASHKTKNEILQVENIFVLMIRSKSESDSKNLYRYVIRKNKTAFLSRILMEKLKVVNFHKADPPIIQTKHSTQTETLMFRHSCSLEKERNPSNSSF